MSTYIVKVEKNHSRPNLQSQQTGFYVTKGYLKKSSIVFWPAFMMLLWNALSRSSRSVRIWCSGMLFSFAHARQVLKACIASACLTRSVDSSSTVFASSSPLFASSCIRWIISASDNCSLPSPASSSFSHIVFSEKVIGLFMSRLKNVNKVRHNGSNWWTLWFGGLWGRGQSLVEELTLFPWVVSSQAFTRFITASLTVNRFMTVSKESSEDTTLYSKLLLYRIFIPAITCWSIGWPSAVIFGGKYIAYIFLLSLTSSSAAGWPAQLSKSKIALWGRFIDWRWLKQTRCEISLEIFACSSTHCFDWR